MKRYAYVFVVAMVMLCGMHSCTSTNKLFEKSCTENYEALLGAEARLKPHRLKYNDKITVSIWNHEKISIGSLYSVFNSNESFGKWILIDSCGMVSLPKLGAVEIGGLTIDEAERFLESSYSEFIIAPIVNIKVLNWEVTILGEVNSVGNYLIDKEANSIIEMIGKAEGFTTHSNLKKVKLVRQGISYQIDLTENDPRLYKLNLADGDILFVPQKRSKKVTENVPILIPISSLITALAIGFTLFQTN